MPPPLPRLCSVSPPLHPRPASLGPRMVFFCQSCRQSVLCAALPVCAPTGIQGGPQPPWPTAERDSQGKTHTEGFSLEPRFFPPFLCAETKKWGRRRHTTSEEACFVGANCVSFARRSSLRMARKLEISETCMNPGPIICGFFQSKNLDTKKRPVVD